MKQLIFFTILFICISCRNETNIRKANNKIMVSEMNRIETNNQDTIIKSKKHNFKNIVCDLDGDKKNDTVQIVQNINNKKFGLKITYGNKKTDYLGMGKNVIDQGFDDFDWIGIFAKVDKGETYWSNVSEDGEIIVDENEIKEKDKIKLENDAIFVHQAESCGGGIIYLKNGEYQWIQQE